jgi:plasmid stability protein
MANLLVRGIDDALVQALRERAARHGRSAEAEHREILAASLRHPKKRSFAEALAAMPNVGADEDFARLNDINATREAPDVFD